MNPDQLKEEAKKLSLTLAGIGHRLYDGPSSTELIIAFGQRMYDAGFNDGVEAAANKCKRHGNALREHPQGKEASITTSVAYIHSPPPQPHQKIIGLEAQIRIWRLQRLV